jgi:uncharacterized protein YwgA
MDEGAYVLAVIRAAGVVPGRTMLQKLVYLLARIRDEDLSYGAHFYGPYSTSVQKSASALSAAGDIVETVTVMPNWQTDQFDLYQYSYKLSDAGQTRAGELPNDIREQAVALLKTTRRVGAFNQAPLAVAAKVDHIRRVAPDAELEELPRLARDLGWRISADDAEQAQALLGALRLS